MGLAARTGLGGLAATNRAVLDELHPFVSNLATFEHKDQPLSHGAEGWPQITRHLLEWSDGIDHSLQHAKTFMRRLREFANHPKELTDLALGIRGLLGGRWCLLDDRADSAVD